VRCAGIEIEVLDGDSVVEPGAIERCGEGAGRRDCMTTALPPDAVSQGVDVDGL
jgi:hypothetical protein